MLSADELRELADVAVVAATRAGQMVARSRPVSIENKAAGESLASQVVTEVDRRSEEMILDILEPTLERFGLGLLTEEQEDDGSRLTATHFWSVDPLDGTLPFIEGVPGYAVSIALVSRDGEPLIGAVCDPVEGAVWHAIAGHGAFVDGRPWHPAPQPRDAALSVFADRSFLERADRDATIAGLEDIATQLGLPGIELHASAGAVMNAIGVLTHAPACYLKYPGPSGGGSVWDFAATACLFAEVGAVATDIEGRALDLNRADSTFMNHRGVLFATDEDLATHIRAMWAERA